MEGEVEVGRVSEGDAVEGEVVGEVGVDHARHLLAAGGASVFGEVPPGFGGGFAVEDDLAPPWPSMAPSPMMAEPLAFFAVMSGLQPVEELSLTMPQEPGERA